MTIYDGSASPFSYSVGVRVRTPFPNLEVSDTIFRRRKIVISGSIELEGKTYDADYYYLGEFRFPQGNVTGMLDSFLIYLDDRKAIEIKELNVTMSDVLEKGGWEFERYTLRGDDRIIGSAYSDHLNGLRGDDIIAGGRGRNKISGGRGSDTFVINKQGTQLITDFNVKRDQLDLPGASPSLDDYNVFERRGKTVLALDNTVLAAFTGAPNLAAAVII